MIIRIGSLICGSCTPWCCRFRKIISNRIGLTCGVLAREQFVLLGFPGDHEQSGTAVVVPDCIPRLELRRLNPVTGEEGKRAILPAAPHGPLGLIPDVGCPLQSPPHPSPTLADL